MTNHKLTLQQKNNVRIGTKKAMTKEVCKDISDKIKNLWNDPIYRNKCLDGRRKNYPVEIRVCKCGCKQTFKCLKKSTQKYINLEHYHKVPKSKECLEKQSRSLKGKNTLKWYIEKYGEKHGNIKYDEYCKKLSNVAKGKTKSKQHGENISKAKKGKTPEDLMGAEKAKEYRKKLRIKRVEQIEKNNNNWANYSKIAIPILLEFKKINNLTNCWFAENPKEYYIKELGYFLDFVDFDIKLIIEVDESRHFNKDGMLKEKDIIRQKEIQEFYPDFVFLRFRDTEMNKILDIKVKQYAK
jgi:hypothetical protein